MSFTLELMIAVNQVYLVLQTSTRFQEYTNPAYVTSGTPEPERKPNGVAPSTSTLQVLTSPDDPGSSGSTPRSSRRSSIADVAIAMTAVVREEEFAAATQNGQSVSTVAGHNGPPMQPGPRPLKSALAQSTSVSDQSILAQLKRAQQRYTHPYGNNATILEELLYGDEEDFMQSVKQQDSSPAKLVIWITFACFMVGLAGAIILGAGKYPFLIIIIVIIIVIIVLCIL